MNIQPGGGCTHPLEKLRLLLLAEAPEEDRAVGEEEGVPLRAGRRGKAAVHHVGVRNDRHLVAEPRAAETDTREGGIWCSNRQC